MLPAPLHPCNNTASTLVARAPARRKAVLDRRASPARQADQAASSWRPPRNRSRIADLEVLRVGLDGLMAAKDIDDPNDPDDPGGDYIYLYYFYEANG